MPETLLAVIVGGIGVRGRGGLNPKDPSQLNPMIIHSTVRNFVDEFAVWFFLFQAVRHHRELDGLGSRRAPDRGTVASCCELRRPVPATARIRSVAQAKAAADGAYYL